VKRAPPYTRDRNALDPRVSNIGLDSGSLDSHGPVRSLLVNRFCELVRDGTFKVVIARGVRDEISHPNTPNKVKGLFFPRIYNRCPELIASQREQRLMVKEILRGNARSGTHDADASHLSEAAEIGCSYFVTYDNRVLDKRGELRSAIPPTLTIVTLEEFFEIYDAYAAGRPLSYPA
jgi:predicted nucleic acid-binding protein